MQSIKVRKPLFIWVVIFALLAGCNMPSSSSGVSVWIDVPLDGLTFPDVQAIKIEGHASSIGGIGRVEIWIDGALLTTVNDPPMEGSLASFHAEWTPPMTGEYTIQAISFGADGTASSPDSARVIFGGAPATPVSGCPTPVGGGPTPVSCTEAVGSGCPTPVGGGPTPVSCVTLVAPIIPIITDTPTLPPLAETIIQFWADPSTVAAGACTTVRWHVENASRVVFGNVDQALDGSYSACLCENTRYTLRVTRLDGVEETRTVDIAVTGSCVTPIVPPPAVPPPAPTLMVPANDLTIACKASQSLVWLPVSDPSGISEYKVQVQRHGGDNNWQLAPGGAISVSGKQASVPVECGWYYRWRVRAVNGAGLTGAWSDWSLFAITLN